MTTISLYQFMPYGAPELKEVARKYMVRAVGTASVIWIVVFMLSFGTTELLKHRPHETSVIVVPNDSMNTTIQMTLAVPTARTMYLRATSLSSGAP